MAPRATLTCHLAPMCMNTETGTLLSLTLFHSLSLSVSLALSSLGAAAMAMAAGGAPMAAVCSPSPIRLTPDATSTTLPSFASS